MDEELRRLLRELEAKTPELVRLVEETVDLRGTRSLEAVSWLNVLRSAVELVSEAEYNLRRLVLDQGHEKIDIDPSGKGGAGEASESGGPNPPVGGAPVGARVPVGPRSGAGGAAKTFAEAEEPPRSP